MQRLPRIMPLLTLLVSCLVTGPAQAETYAYDNAGRLVSIEYDDGIGISYSYDQTGNQTAMTLVNPDIDDDGVPDVTDNCPSHPNTDQINTDNDALGNVCDPDDDNDTIPDTVEVAYGLDPLNATDASSDLDNDGLDNATEYALGSRLDSVDSDSDGVSDGDEVQQGRNPAVNEAVIIQILQAN